MFTVQQVLLSFEKSDMKGHLTLKKKLNSVNMLLLLLSALMSQFYVPSYLLDYGECSKMGVELF